MVKKGGELRNLEAGLMTIDLFRDGNAIGVMIGRNLQDGVSGWGDTVPEALRDLALAIERERWQFPELEAPRGGPVRVK